MIAAGNIDRSTYLGGSDIAAILGISPWRTPLDVFLDKTEGKQPDDPSKAQIFKRGQRLEPYILDMLSEEHGIEIVQRGQRYKDAEFGYMAAEIDAETSDGRNVEAKSVHLFGAKAWGAEHTDEIPVYYTAQVQHGLMVTERDECLVPALIGLDDFRVYRVQRDEEIITSIRQAEVDFWARIQRGDAPPATNLADVLRMFPSDDATALKILEGDPLIQHLEKLKFLKSKLKLMEAEHDELAEQIKMAFGASASLKIGAKVLATYKGQSAERFDSSAFRAKHPKIYSKFTKTSTSRVLRLK